MLLFTRGFLHIAGALLRNALQVWHRQNVNILELLKLPVVRQENITAGQQGTRQLQGIH